MAPVTIGQNVQSILEKKQIYLKKYLKKKDKDEEDDFEPGSFFKVATCKRQHFTTTMNLGSFKELDAIMARFLLMVTQGTAAKTCGFSPSLFDWLRPVDSVSGNHNHVSYRGTMKSDTTAHALLHHSLKWTGCHLGLYGPAINAHKNTS